MKKNEKRFREEQIIPCARCREAARLRKYAVSWGGRADLPPVETEVCRKGSDGDTDRRGSLANWGDSYILNLNSCAGPGPERHSPLSLMTTYPTQQLVQVLSEGA